MAEADKNERTTAVGLYHFARSYRAAADFLRTGPTRRESTHPDAPRDFLYIHSVELYFKAYLRAAGFGVSALKDIGHAIPKLAEEACKKGVILDHDGKRVVELLTSENVFGARYIVIGAYRRAHTDALAEISRLLHGQVREFLRGQNEICAD